MLQEGTTICAPATASGGALAIIRLSGKEAISLLDKFFQPADNKVNISLAKGYSIFFGNISSAAGFIDEVIVSVFRSPHSYTGEDMVEISCHGSPFIQRRLMEIFIAAGAAPASPGEFTMRAFMNGKMDLSQAEAVADIIAADSEAAHRLASSQLKGGLSAEIEKLRQEMLHFAALIELELDFSEEDVVFADRLTMTGTILKIRHLVDSLSSSFRLGNAIRKGIPVVLAGKTNVGKSSLLNVLLKEERAIVSSLPGTTRDTVEEVLHLGGFVFRFIDTAGLRDGVVNDEIEAQGIERTMQKVRQADIVIIVCEADAPVDNITADINLLNGFLAEESVRIAVINKADLISPERRDDMSESLLSHGVSALFVSAKTGEGVEILKSRLIESVKTEGLNNPQYIVTNIRHYNALINVSACLERADDGFRTGVPTELIATDIRQAIYYLGQITGKITPDDILGDIFANFCIGK